MNKHEQLQEQYEDTLFALLMDSVAQAEGKKGLEENAWLQQDPDAALPDATVRRSLQTIEKGCRRQNSRTVRHTLGTAAKHLAVAVTVAVLMCSAAFATIPAFRHATLNLLVEVFDDGSTDFRFTPTEEDTTEFFLTANWIPGNYTLANSDEEPNHGRNIQAWYKYIGPTETYIDLKRVSGDTSAYYVDTEDAVAEEIEIQGYPSTLVLKEDVYTLIIPCESNNFFVVLSANNISRNDFIKIAENLEF